MDVNVEFYSPSIVRVYKTPSQKSCNKESLVIVKTPESTPVSFGEKGKNVTLSSRLIQVEVNPETGGIHFFDSSGQRLLTDKDYGTQFTPFNDAGVPSFNVRQAFLRIVEESSRRVIIPIKGISLDGMNEWNADTHILIAEKQFLIALVHFTRLLLSRTEKTEMLIMERHASKVRKK